MHILTLLTQRLLDGFYKVLLLKSILVYFCFIPDNEKFGTQPVQRKREREGEREGRWRTFV